MVTTQPQRAPLGDRLFAVVGTLAGLGFVGLIVAVLVGFEEPAAGFE